MLYKPKNIKSWKQIPTRITPKLRSLLEDIKKENGCSWPVASNMLADRVKQQEEELKKIKRKIPMLDFNFKV